MQSFMNSPSGDHNREMDRVPIQLLRRTVLNIKESPADAKIDELRTTGKLEELINNSEELKEIRVLLTGIDSRTVRPLRALISGLGTLRDIQELQDLELSAQELRKKANDIIIRLEKENNGNFKSA